MAHTIIHPEIRDGTFVDDTEVIVVHKSVQDAVDYYDSKLKPAVARRIADNRLAVLNDVKKNADGIATSLIVRDRNPDNLLSIVNTKHFRDFTNMQERGEAEDERLFGIHLPNIWKVHLYQFKDFGGKKFSLDLMFKDCDYDKDLGNNDFDNRTSSVDTGKLVILTILAQYPWFKGDWCWLYEDCKNLAKKDFDNRTSSVGATGVSVWTLVALLEAIAAAAA